ncbi:MAG: ABC transporter permease [Pseudomonadota bacterium]
MSAVPSAAPRRFRAALSPGVWMPLATVAAALLVGLVLVALAGVKMLDALAAFADGAWGSGYAIGASLNRATALALVAIGFVFANRAGLTNVGGEGQIAVGGIVATAIAIHAGAAQLPGPLAWMVPLLLAALAGGLWGAVAGALKVKVGTNEVISTLLLSFVGVWLLYWCVQSVNLLRQPMTSSATLPESLDIPEATHVPMLFADGGVPMHAGVPIVLVLAAVVALLLSRGAIGMQLTAVGMNPVAARRAGIGIGSSVMLAMFVAGAFAGLAGGFMLQGEQFVLRDRFSSGYGFDGLVVGLLARGSMKGVLASALLFGFLRSGGIQMELVAGVPSAIVLLVQGIVILALAGAAHWLPRQQTGSH